MCGFIYNSATMKNVEVFQQTSSSITHRGPDNYQFVADQCGTWGFHRLSIMDLSAAGNQPFKFKEAEAVCNGEIYNFHQIRHFLKDKYTEYTFTSDSDCEVLLPLFFALGADCMVKMLDGEFALVINDAASGTLLAARDPMGIRPLFYGYDKETGKIAFASEAKGLIPFCEKVTPFPPGHYYLNGEFVCYNDLSTPRQIVTDDFETVTTKIREKLEAAVDKRLEADAPIGYLLSGGLDSSLVCAIATKKLGKKIKTFAVGMDTDPIDLKYAKEVADYLGTEHYEIIMTKDQVLSVLDKLIWHLETWDITTIRASVGMYLICKWIHENTDLKVLLTGEVSDELFGYKYTDFAPSPAAFQAEAAKRVKELYMYDVLRADRCLAAHSLEARVPFADTDFVQYVMSVNPALKMNTYNKGKYLLRKAFAGTDYLPESILMREKAAFSDAVGHSMVDHLKAYAEEKYTDADLEAAKEKYPHGTPFTKESLLYRDIFEKHYPGQGHLIKDFWMPNKEWVGKEVNDPSARVLKNYGDSGK
ncbi:asparagine synthase B [Psittacicella gerlachiana]|uniref:asparagine synthase (glutamine-hydrolyzing) n=1 Tax=Psittacicella gerlachiana TaxID=2028574 RepID=A0A3A1Y8R2_9GAMM|nr:asparagine synthase B [Psittacicella gerlachiana]RIY32507.1 asparagine synthase B [Psittacicella gerlachiana]